MPFNKVTEIGASENILDSSVGLVVKSRTGKKTMATADGDRKVIKAGTLYTNPDDNTDIGVVLEDVDMTDDDARPIAVVKEGRLKKDKVAAAVKTKESDLKAIGIRLV